MDAAALSFINRMGKGQPLSQNVDGVDSSGNLPAASDLRFAYSLLEKLIQYLDVAALNMKHLRPSGNYSRRSSFKTSTRDVKFFSKVYIYKHYRLISSYLNLFLNLGRVAPSGKIFQHPSTVFH